MYQSALGLWLLFLAAAAFYVRRARPPDAKPVAAYLIFVTVFTATAFGLFVAFTLALRLSGQAGALSHPVAAALFLLAVFAPAFLAGRWQLRKPPMRRPRP